MTYLNLDDKGRLAIPARYRKQLATSCEGQIITTLHWDGCVLIYPLPEWKLVEQKLEALPNTDRTTRLVQRMLEGFAEACTLDAQGRILLAPALRGRAGLDKQVVLVGQFRKFELWNSEVWEAQIDEALDRGRDADQLSALLVGLSF